MNFKEEGTQGFRGHRPTLRYKNKVSGSLGLPGVYKGKGILKVSWRVMSVLSVLSEQNLISRSLDDLHLHDSSSSGRSELISTGKHQRHYCYHVLNLNHFDHHHGL